MFGSKRCQRTLLRIRWYNFVRNTEILAALKIQQIADGTPFGIRAERSKARRRGHPGLTQRTYAVYVI